MISLVCRMCGEKRGRLSAHCSKCGSLDKLGLGSAIFAGSLSLLMGLAGLLSVGSVSDSDRLTVILAGGMFTLVGVGAAAFAVASLRHAREWVPPVSPPAPVKHPRPKETPRQTATATPSPTLTSSHAGTAKLKESAGVEILRELCTRMGILFEDPYIDRAVAAFESEGAHGSDRLAELIDDLLLCRSPKLPALLKVAARVEPTDLLIQFLQEVRGAESLTSPPSKLIYTPEILGGGQIGWSDGTADRIRALAGKALENLTGAVVEKKPTILPGADLSGADLAGADLAGADLSGTSLANANLEGASIKESNLSNANLEGANLRKASLYFANLTGASLDGADLTEANLYMSNMEGATLVGANLREAYAPALTLPDGLRGDRDKLLRFVKNAE